VTRASLEESLPKSSALNLGAKVRLIILLLITLITLITFPAPLFADVISDVKLKYKLSPIEEGEEAPFAGYLLNPDALAKIWSDYELLEKEKKLEIDYLTLKFEKQMETKDELFNSNKKMYENQLNLQSTYIDKLEENVLEDDDWTTAWFAGGAVSGIVVSILIFYAAVEIRN